MGQECVTTTSYPERWKGQGMKEQVYIRDNQYLMVSKRLCSLIEIDRIDENSTLHCVVTSVREALGHRSYAIQFRGFGFKIHHREGRVCLCLAQLASESKQWTSFVTESLLEALECVRCVGFGCCMPLFGFEHCEETLFESVEVVLSGYFFVCFSIVLLIARSKS